MKSFGGNAVLLSLPYQINSLPGYVRLLMCKGNETKIEIGEQMLLRIALENGGNAVLLTLPYQIISLTYHGTNVHGQCNKYCENKLERKY